MEVDPQREMQFAVHAVLCQTVALIRRFPPRNRPAPPHLCIQALSTALAALMEQAVGPEDYAPVGQVPTNGARRGPVGTSSRFRGVTRHRRTRRYEAHIWLSKKQMYLGGYNTEVSGKGLGALCWQDRVTSSQLIACGD